MLVLTRNIGETLVIGKEKIRVTVTNIKGNQAKLAVEAPRYISVLREELGEPRETRHR